MCDQVFSDIFVYFCPRQSAKCYSLKPALEFIENRFNTFNTLCFNGELKPLPIRLSDAKSYIGKVVYRYKRQLLGRKHYYDFRMLINTRIDMDEREWEDTILHEMIHYYILSHQMEDSSSHGVIFCRMMNDINRQYGRHITISKHLTESEKEQLAGTKTTLHVFALVSTKDGKELIKVVPRIKSRVVEMNRRLKAIDDIQSVRWYYSSDPYFNQFPTSTAMRLQYIDKDEMAKKLTDCHPIEF